MDNLLAALLTGDFGMMAKSKGYYCHVKSSEIWRAAGFAYAALGWGEAVPEPLTILPFGASVVPSNQYLLAIDLANLERLDLLRPAQHTSIETDLAFHKAYVIALAFRLKARLVLRNARLLPINATTDENSDSTVDVEEKASAGRSGEIAAILSDDAKAEIRAFRLHCEALFWRLSKKHFKGVGMQWLLDVVHSKNAPLLAWIEANGSQHYLSTKSVMDNLGEGVLLAPDFGRKWMENALRLAGCRTSDIDRALRHEVLGQETTTTVADASERTWIKRMGTAMDKATKQIFATELRGLRRN